MDPLLKLIAFLPGLDWLAMVLFFVSWTTYAHFARTSAHRRPSILATTNRWRRHWMVQATHRENRIVDSAVVQNLSGSPQFFASTSILIIGGLLAVLGTTDKATELLRDLPLAARTSVLVFDLKLVVLTGIFVYSYFRFTWSLRQYSFGAILVGAMPAAGQIEDAARQAMADRAGRVMGLAAETFNDGLRGYYLSFAVVAWFFSSWAFIVATFAVLWVLYRREFHSEVLVVLRDGLE